MFKINRILSLIAAFALIVVTANAQEKPPALSTNTNYETILQLVAASNDSTQKNSLPPNLENVSRQIKNDFGYSNYRVVLSSLNRINPNGSTVQAKGLVPITTVGTNALTFYEISFATRLPIEKQQTQTVSNGEIRVGFPSFRFDLRVPVPVKVNDASGASTAINYEQFGITNTGLAFTENEPTIIGTLSSSRADELLILVMTVREAKADARNLAKKR